MAKKTKKVVKKTKKASHHARVVQYKGKAWKVKDLAKELGCAASSIFERLRKGMSDQEAIASVKLWQKDPSRAQSEARAREAAKRKKAAKKAAKKAPRKLDGRRATVRKGEGRHIRYKGKRLTVIQLANALGVNQSMVYSRVRKGLSDKEILKSLKGAERRGANRGRGLKPNESAVSMESVAQALVNPGQMPPAGLLKVIRILVNMDMLNDAAFREAVRELIV